MADPTRTGFPVNVIYNPASTPPLSVHPPTVHVNAKHASVVWKLEGPPGSLFDPTSGIVWNAGVQNPPGTPKRVDDTHWILDEDNLLVSGDQPISWAYTVNVRASKDSKAIARIDPEVENDPVTGHPEPLPPKKPHSD